MSVVRAWVTVRCSVRSKGMKELQLYIRCGSDVRAMGRLSFRVMVRHGRH